MLIYASVNCAFSGFASLKISLVIQLHTKRAVATQLVEQPFSLFDREYHQLTICSDAERRAPERESARYIYRCLAPLPESVALLIHSIDDIVQWPHLTAMRMTAELQIDTLRARFLKVVGLVVDDDYRFRCIGLCNELGKRRARAVGAILTTDDLHAVGECCDLVAQ